ncbi:MAG: hypothetical protein IPL13_13720 [Saprospiraceae bacterium]|nr:hypothetical protein [Candidatus Brachybacter algidus]
MSMETEMLMVFILIKVIKVYISESQYIGHSDKIGINSKALAGYSLTINNSNIQGKRILTDYRLNAIENYSNSDYSYMNSHTCSKFSIYLLQRSQFQCGSAKLDLS